MDTIVDDGVLVVTELVSNAARHAGGNRIRVTVSRPAPCSAEIAVIDPSPAPPQARMAAPDEENGRGLALVDELTKDWGTDRLPTGKRVWGLLTCEGVQ
jgi:anti-sigma regulatory factor (Ser/Thr protein kinase)